MTAPGNAPPTVADEEGVSSSPWYKSRAWLVTVVLVAVVAVTVATDLPGHASRSGAITNDSKVMTYVNQDVGPCSSAVGKSFTIYGDLLGHTLTASEAHQVPGLLRDDQAACSLTDDSIYQLSTIDVPGSASGRDIGELVRTVTVWATSDALSTIEQIRTLDSDPTNGTARQVLAHDAQLLDQDQQRAEDELGAADALLQTKLPKLHLTQAPAYLSRA